VINKNSILAVIPARGGSKRLPHKNILYLQDKPLIAWSIEAGLKSKYVDEVMVTTDDEEIAQIATKYGARVPFLRPKELATDTATTFAAIKHTIEFYQNNFLKVFNYILLLQPTSPLRSQQDIDRALELLEEKSGDAVISVCETEHSPLWANTLPKDLSMSNFLKEETKNKRSQDLDKYYRLNGAIYIYKTKKLLEEETFFLKDNIFAYIMPQESSIDIDTLLDFKICEAILNNRL